jgi:hypothetical protein
MESLLKIDLSYIHFDFQFAHLMDSKPIEVLVDTCLVILDSLLEMKSLSSNLVVVIA